MAPVRQQGLAGPLPVRPPRRLRFIHYGEGEYLETELAIQECCRATTVEPARRPVRPEDAPGVLLEPQTADIVLPADRERLELVRDWADGED